MEPLRRRVAKHFVCGLFKSEVKNLDMSGRFPPVVLIFVATLKGQRMSIGLVSLGLMLFYILFCVTFDAFGETLLELMETLPGGFQALFKSVHGSSSPSMTYLGVGLREPILLIIVSGFVIAASSGAMAREIERGSILLLLSRPVSRLQMMIAKLGSMLVGLVLLQVFVLIGILIGVAAYGIPEVEIQTILLVLVNGFFLSASLGGIAYAVSSVSSDGSRATAASAVIFVVLFFVDYLAESWPTVEVIGPASPFHYYDPVGVISAGAIPLIDLVALACFMSASLALSGIAFNRRDIL